MRKIVADYNKDLKVQVNIYFLKIKLKIYRSLTKDNKSLKKITSRFKSIQKFLYAKREKPFRYSLLIISFFLYGFFFNSRHMNYSFLYFTRGLKFFATFCFDLAF